MREHLIGKKGSWVVTFWGLCVTDRDFFLPNNDTCCHIEKFPLFLLFVIYFFLPHHWPRNIRCQFASIFCNTFSGCRGIKYLAFSHPLGGDFPINLVVGQPVREKYWLGKSPYVLSVHTMSHMCRCFRLYDLEILKPVDLNVCLLWSECNIPFLITLPTLPLSTQGYKEEIENSLKHCQHIPHTERTAFTTEQEGFHMWRHCLILNIRSWICLKQIFLPFFFFHLSHDQMLCKQRKRLRTMDNVSDFNLCWF